MRGQAVAGGCECFVVRDVDGGEFRAGHAGERQGIEGRVDDGDVHGDVDRAGFGLAGFDADVGGVEGEVGKVGDCWGSFAGGGGGHGGVRVVVGWA